MTLEAQKFLIKEVAPKNTPVQSQRIKSLSKVPALSLRSIEKDRYSEYAPTPIWQTRHSEFWQWQRVSEWWREFGEDEQQDLFVNEKRHIY